MNLLKTGGLKLKPALPTAIGPTFSAKAGSDSVANSLADTMELPNKKSVPRDDIDAFTFYFYGYQKIGKTSLTSMFADCCHIFYEPSGEDYSLFSFEPKTWDHFKAFIIKCEREKESGTLKFKNFAIDIVDLCYHQCMKAICAQGGFDHPPSDYGKTYDKIRSEFRSWIYRLAKVGGVIFISHAKEAEIERADGNKYSVVIPACSGQCHDILSKFCTMTGYYHVLPSMERVLGIMPNNIYEAGNRFRNHFQFKDTGEKMSVIPMGTSEQEAYRNFRLAYDNLLSKPEEGAVEIKAVKEKTPFTIRRSVT
jgi:hypothetical protein